jgi:hypothetical protein
MKTSALILCLLLAAPVDADDHVTFVKDAFESISTDFHEEWAFTHVETEDDVELIGRYDPSLVESERWQLISVNGREPTADESADYRWDKSDEFHDDDKESDDGIIDYESLVLIEDTPELRVYRFSPNFGEEEDDDDMGAKFLRDVEGTLSIARDGNYVQSIELRNERTIRPIFSVKIKQFLTHLQFGPADGVGPIVPLSVEVEVKGRAALVVKIDERESVRFTDYERTGT